MYDRGFHRKANEVSFMLEYPHINVPAFKVENNTWRFACFVNIGMHKDI